jgi:ubiquinone/menaquinone biosynthesis C-methylase UbiE
MTSQTPLNFEYNRELLNMIPADCNYVVEVGCGSGVLARAYKDKNKNRSYWHGIDIDPYYTEVAHNFCDTVTCIDLDLVDTSFYENLADADCWVFGDSLEHLKDPWLALAEIYSVMPAGGYIAACVPNSQHWSVWLQMALGEFNYQDSGLMDRTHLRWFSRKTSIALFEQAGFKVLKGVVRQYHENNREFVISKFLEFCAEIGIKNLSEIEKDLKPQQYVFLAQKIGDLNV